MTNWDDFADLLPSSFIEAMKIAGPLVLAVCCRTWEVFTYAPIGPCGYCHTVPVRL